MFQRKRQPNTTAYSAEPQKNRGEVYTDTGLRDVMYEPGLKGEKRKSGGIGISESEEISEGKTKDEKRRTDEQGGLEATRRGATKAHSTRRKKKEGKGQE